MANIIRFPEKNDKMQTVKKANQKALLYLSLASVLLFAMVLNLSYQSKLSKERDVANITNIDGRVLDQGVSNLNGWVLTHLNSSNQRNEIVFSEKPSAEEQLVFESLIGRYSITKNKDFITELHIKEGSEPVLLSQLPKLLNQYRQANGVENIEFRLVKQGHNEHIYEMYSADKKIGDVQLKVSKDNELISLTSSWN